MYFRVKYVSKNMAKSTRTSAINNLREAVGPSKDFLTSEIPSWRAVFQRGFLLQDQFENQHFLHKKRYPLSEVSKDLAKLICAQWKESNSSFIPPRVIKEKTIAEKICDRWKRLTKAVNGNISETVATSAISELDTLLDICVCKHTILLCVDFGCSGCSNKAHITCDCALTTKIPTVEWIYHQRAKTTEKSALQISTVDYKETNRMSKAAKRKDQEAEMALKRMKKEQANNEELNQRIQLSDKEDCDIADTDDSSDTNNR